MKTNKFQKLANKMTERSLNSCGELVQSGVEFNLETVRKMPLSQALPLLREYLRQLKRNIVEKTAQIETATPLSNSDLTSLTQKIKFLHGVTQIKTIIDPSLFGGLRLKIGDVVYDDSISERIKQLRSKVGG